MKSPARNLGRSRPARPFALGLLSRAAWVALAALAFLEDARADTFTLKDGRRLEGSIVRESAKSVTIRADGEEHEVARADIVSTKPGKTQREIYFEREAACTSAEQLFQLGEWARGEKLKALATRACERAVVLDPKHAGAQTALGKVLYKDEWMLPEERDVRAAADEVAEMTARGLVRHEDRWVTPEDKANLERGLVEYEGRWVTVDESMTLRGFEQFEGRWISRDEALTRRDVAEVAKIANKELPLVLTEDVVIAGTFPQPFLEKIATTLTAGRAWFARAFQLEPGLEVLGGRRAEFYVWAGEDAPYVATCPHFAALTPTVAPDWGERVKRAHGLYWVDPYSLSSARAGGRKDEDMLGHCLHHWGHLLANRLAYDGKLLPPWYDEATAAVTEFTVTRRNAVFCREKLTVPVSGGGDGGPVTGKARKKADVPVEGKLFREGGWEQTLKEALAAGTAPSFDRLGALEFAELEMIDIAMGMAIVQWLESRGPDALSKFHAVVRKHQPRAPERVVKDESARRAMYEEAFQAAAGMGWVAADREWRPWFLSR